MKTIKTYIEEARALGACKQGLIAAAGMTADEIVKRWPVWAARVAGCNMTQEQLMLACRSDGHVIIYLTAEQRTEAICLAAVQRDGYVVQHLSAEERTEAVCLAAVQQIGDAICHLSPDQRTADVCRAAVENHAYALRHLSPEQRTKAVLATAG